jgi:hypothetical protein
MIKKLFVVGIGLVVGVGYCFAMEESHHVVRGNDLGCVAKFDACAKELCEHFLDKNFGTNGVRIIGGEDGQGCIVSSGMRRMSAIGDQIQREGLCITYGLSEDRSSLCKIVSHQALVLSDEREKDSDDEGEGFEKNIVSREYYPLPIGAPVRLKEAINVGHDIFVTVGVVNESEEVSEEHDRQMVVAKFDFQTKKWLWCSFLHSDSSTRRFFHPQLVRACPRGGVLVAGQVVNTLTRGSRQYCLLKLTEDGQCDHAFGIDGVLAVPEELFAGITFSDTCICDIQFNRHDSGYCILHFAFEGGGVSDHGSWACCYSVQTPVAVTRDVIHDFSCLINIKY